MTADPLPEFAPIALQHDRAIDWGPWVTMLAALQRVKGTSDLAMLEWAVRLGIELAVTHPEWAAAWRADALEHSPAGTTGARERADWVVAHIPLSREL